MQHKHPYYALALMLSCLFVACASAPKPPKRIKLPSDLAEASGLAIENMTNFYLHNDSGDGPILYKFNPQTRALSPRRIPAQAQDWEDITSDPDGNLYLADMGNNLGKRQEQTIYRYEPVTGQTDSVVFTYPHQNGQGRLKKGNYDCEAIVYFNDQLHLFTKALPGRRNQYWAYHFRLPAEPGYYQATLVDSLYLPRRVITAAALDTLRRELVFTTYNYKRVLGFFPAVASSLITISDFPEDEFFRGKAKRRNLSWAFPSQYEAVDFYDYRFLYIGTEKTVLKPQQLRRIRRH